MRRSHWEKSGKDHLYKHPDARQDIIVAAVNIGGAAPYQRWEVRMRCQGTLLRSQKTWRSLAAAKRNAEIATFSKGWLEKLPPEATETKIS